MAKKIDLTEKVKELMLKPDKIRNIGIVAHIDHGKTTLSDNLLAGAGMISEELAGKQLYMDYDKQEQERGITIYSANVSMVHEFKGDHYLINLIGTPGHVDFGGDVTRAMRAVDGAVVVACAVEGVMPQTETVLRQALKERVKPVLFINKVDRLIKELKLGPEEMQKRFMKIIAEVNRLIKKYAEDNYKNWTVNVNDGSVAFGSAYRNWAISFPFMKETGITFKDIIEYSSQDRDKELAKKAPLHEVVFNMIIEHLPNPLEAQKYRIPKIWGGDLESDIGKSMMNCDPNGKLACIVTKVYTDPHAGSVATARIFSGKMRSGQEVYLVGQHKKERVQQVCIYKGPQRITMDEITAGNIVGLIGLSSVFSGETVCDPEEVIHPFESIKHIFEPVVTKAIEAKKASDLPKIIEILRKISREDPSLKIEINQETGEHLVSGLGELHLEAKVERKIKEEGIEIESSPPIVVYRETVTKKAGPIEGKSPNKHNKFYIEVEPLPKSVYQAMVEDKIPEGEVKKKDPELTAKLRELGLNEIDAKGVKMIYNRNILVDATKGIQYLNEVIELLKQAFKEVMDEGPISKEPCSSVIVRLVDAELHEDSIHRGPAQVIPAVKFAIRNAMLMAGPTLLEPKQIVRIEVPQEEMGSAMREVQNRRGEILDVESGEGISILKAKIPVAEMFGFEGMLKSATGGKGFYYLIDVVFEKIPRELLEKTVSHIRTRKGMDPEFPKPEV
ncbi:MAG: elongation factor EF-2 [Candidatus Aenigmarchaeota archaeon]|nr:elongation factor EF-2 [Candidatus Aenigmarchaeota archaeon]